MTARILFETKQLEFRPFSSDDIVGFYDLNKNAEVIKYTGDKPFFNHAEVKQFIDNYNHYERHGYGRWSLYLKSSGEYIGFSGLKFSDKNQETDIGFRIMQKHWGKGYATESAIEGLRIAFCEFNLNKVVARAMQKNTASHAVIKKLGMTQEKTFTEDKNHWVQYQIDITQWKLMRGQ